MAAHKLDPTCNSELIVYRYKNIKNIKDLLKEAKEGTLKCAMLNPEVVYDAFQIVIAANKAVLSQKSNSMTTRSVYSELIYNLSPSKNIMKSLSTFGIDVNSPGTDALIAIIRDDQTDEGDVLQRINGEQCPDTYSLRNVDKIRKVYNVKGDCVLNKIITVCAVK